MDCNNIPFAERAVDPDETGLATAYTFGEGELAQFGRYLNRARTGAVYDLTRVGTPIVGQGGGIYGVNLGGAYYSCPFIPVGGSNLAYSVHLENDIHSTGHAVFLNGGGVHRFTLAINDRVYFTLNNGATNVDTGFPVLGRGPVWYDGLYDGTQEILVANGRQAAAINVVPTVLAAGNFYLGEHGATRLAKVYSVRRTVAQARASYVREFARRVVWSLKPVEVGEGPAGGILTNSTPGGYSVCPLGGATLQHVWRPDLSIPAGGRLCLTDSGALSLRRVAYAHTKMPVYGSWLLEYQVRDPATDSLQFALTPLPETDYTTATSASYWVNVRQVAGPWWRASLYLANGAQIDAVDTPSLPIVGDRGKILLTHAVDGSWQIYSYLQSLHSWYWSVASPVDVGAATSNYVVIAPRGAFVEGVVRYQSEADPHELAIVP